MPRSAESPVFVLTTPSLTASAVTGTPKCVDAISSSTRRASAATRRIG
jgi:hypothetical protein